MLLCRSYKSKISLFIFWVIWSKKFFFLHGCRYRFRFRALMRRQHETLMQRLRCREWDGMRSLRRDETNKKQQKKKRRSKVGEDEWENLFWESSINQCNHTHEIYDTKRRLVSSENENIDLKIKLHFLCGELKAPTLRFQNVGCLSTSKKKIISYLFGAAAYKRYIILYILFFSALLFLLGRSTSYKFRAYTQSGPMHGKRWTLNVSIGKESLVSFFRVRWRQANGEK